MCNLIGKAVEVAVNAGVTRGGMIDVESQAIAARGDADAGDISILNGDDRLVDRLLCLEVDTRVEMVAPQFAKVAAESRRDGDRVSVCLGENR